MMQPTIEGLEEKTHTDSSSGQFYCALRRDTNAQKDSKMLYEWKKNFNIDWAFLRSPIYYCSQQLVIYKGACFSEAIWGFEVVKGHILRLTRPPLGGGAICSLCLALSLKLLTERGWKSPGPTREGSQYGALYPCLWVTAFLQPWDWGLPDFFNVSIKMFLGLGAQFSGIMFAQHAQALGSISRVQISE